MLGEVYACGAEEVRLEFPEKVEEAIGVLWGSWRSIRGLRSCVHLDRYLAMAALAADFGASDKFEPKFMLRAD